MTTRQVLGAWWRTRQALRMSPAQLAARRQHLWRALQPALARTPALAGLAGQALDQFPVTELMELRADYGLWNSLGLSDAALRVMADAAETGAPGGAISAGWSTGSGGGQRGLFVASPAERADYLGQSLALLLPAKALLARQRLALHLRASNALYGDVARRRFGFAHFPLSTPPAENTTALEAWSPTILVAPPHRLLMLAEVGVKLPDLRHLFCGSEPLSLAERATIAAHFGLPPRNIHQATEGFLAAECASGRLHLNDQALELECEPVPGTTGFRLIIIDLRRTSQPIVRVRGDDYIEVDPRPCPCGFGGRVIAPVQGRVQDIWRLTDRVITPPQVVAALDPVLGAGQRWQAVASRAAITLRLAPGCGQDQARAAAKALMYLCGQPVATQLDLPPWPGPKRRKMVWNHD